MSDTPAKPESAKDLVDKLWELKDWQPMIDALGDPMAVIKIMLLIMTGLYTQQWVYGADDAPLPSTAQDWTPEQWAQWKKDHPGNHLDDNPMATISSKYVTHNPLFKDDPNVIYRPKE
jgi:hypothetical protein